MPSTIITKNGSGAPLAADLVAGELAVDLTNGRLYTEDTGGSVIEIGLNPSGNVDVTGTVTADGLTVSDTTGTVASLTSSATTTALNLNNTHANGWGSNIAFQTGGTAAGFFGSIGSLLGNTDQDLAAYSAAGNGFRVYTNGNNERLRIDSAGNVGIGTTSPNSLTHIYGGASGRTWTVDGNDLFALENDSSLAFDIRTPNASQGLILFSDADARAQGIVGYSHSNDFMYFNTNGSEAVRIDSSGNVGIGTASPVAPLTIGGTSQVSFIDSAQGGITTNEAAGVTASVTGYALKYRQNVGSGFHSWETSGNTTAGGALTYTEAMRIDSIGRVGIGTSSPGTFLHIQASSGGSGFWLDSSETSDQTNRFVSLHSSGGTYSTLAIDAGQHLFRIGTSEAARIDASGNVLVGKTANDNTSNGFVLDSNGTLNAVRSSEYLMRLNRTSTDGEIARFQKDGSTVGSIGTTSSTMWIAGNSTEDTGIRFYTVGIAPCDSSGTYRDNSRDLGSSTVRWDDIYATNNIIQTSDRNEKQDIEELSEAEHRVAVACKGLLRKFRWKSSVEEKGDDARIHFGIIAQDLQAAFEAEGLDAGRYAMFINSTWTDEETGEERSRMGVRYSELLAFIIAAI